MRKGDETFEEAARARVAGEIGDNEFLRRTWQVWVGVTGRLWRRWRRKLPTDIGPDDVQQALMLLALEFVAKCDPARLTEGGSYGGYIVWCATRRTQRQIHKWRNAKLAGDESKNPGRFERCFASLSTREDERREDFVARVAGESADPVERIETERAFREHLAGSETVREALVLLALQRAEGSVDGAAEAIWASYPARVECGARSARHARALVREVVGALTEAPAPPEPVVPPDDFFAAPFEPRQLWERALEARRNESAATLAA